jgi:hypothetical protein
MATLNFTISKRTRALQIVTPSTVIVGDRGTCPTLLGAVRRKLAVMVLWSGGTAFCAGFRLMRGDVLSNCALLKISVDVRTFQMSSCRFECHVVA